MNPGFHSEILATNDISQDRFELSCSYNPGDNMLSQG
jgi:hypothetical protein